MKTIKNILKYTITFFLTLLARAVLTKYRPKIIAVAGSVGKTSTKDAIYTVLNTSLSVWKSEKNYNTEIGVPLAILGLENAWNNPIKWIFNIVRALQLVVFTERYPKYLVLEIGADKPRDIKHIVSWLHPDISVITRFGEVPVHIEFFKDRNELINEDGLVVEALSKNGLLIVNYDDKDSYNLKNKTKARVLSYGFEEQATIVSSNPQIIYDDSGIPTGMTYKISYEGNNMPIQINGAIGNTSVYATLPALLVGREYGINIVEGIEALRNHQSPKGRLRILKGIKGSVIIDDSYNSSPVAVEEALRIFKELTIKGRKIVVLGDMLELGADSEKEHKKIGEKSALATDILVTVGVRARKIAEGALIGSLSDKNIFQFKNSIEAGNFIENFIETGDAILVKGSQGIRMERILENIMADKGMKEKLLVRQDEEWRSR